jgi:ribosome biogenesis GTPase A
MAMVRWWVGVHRESMKATPHCAYPPLNIMVMGLPNTGKSTIINALRVHGLSVEDRTQKKRGQSSVAAVGKNPGFTRSVSSKLKIIDTTAPAGTGHHSNVVHDVLQSKGIRLKVYVMDSPGIVPPYIEQPEDGLKFALCNLLPSDGSMSAIDPIMVAEYLWWRLEAWSMTEPLMKWMGCQDAFECIERLARDRGSLLRDGRPDMTSGAIQLLKLWRSGDLYDQLRQRSPKSVPHDRWRFHIMDGEFDQGRESVHDFAHGLYAEGNSSVRIGSLNVSESVLENATERRRRRRQQVRLTTSR